MNDSFSHLIETEKVHHLALSCQSETHSHYVAKGFSNYSFSTVTSITRIKAHLNCVNNYTVSDIAFIAYIIVFLSIFCLSHRLLYLEIFVFVFSFAALNYYTTALLLVELQTVFSFVPCSIEKVISN